MIMKQHTLSMSDFEIREYRERFGNAPAILALAAARCFTLPRTTTRRRTKIRRRTMHQSKASKSLPVTNGSLETNGSLTTNGTIKTNGSPSTNAPPTTDSPVTTNGPLPTNGALPTNRLLLTTNEPLRTNRQPTLKGQPITNLPHATSEQFMANRPLPTNGSLTINGTHAINQPVTTNGPPQANGPPNGNQVAPPPRPVYQRLAPISPMILPKRGELHPFPPRPDPWATVLIREAQTGRILTLYTNLDKIHSQFRLENGVSATGGWMWKIIWWVEGGRSVCTFLNTKWKTYLTYEVLPDGAIVLKTMKDGRPRLGKIHLGVPGQTRTLSYARESFGVALFGMKWSDTGVLLGRKGTIVDGDWRLEAVNPADFPQYAQECKTHHVPGQCNESGGETSDGIDSYGGPRGASRIDTLANSF